jgi:hypothetical protein
MQSIITQQRSLNRDQGEVAEGVARVQQNQRERIARGERDASRTYADTQRQLTQDFERRQRPIPEFIPTQETARDIGMLASMLMMAGAMLGGKGKQGALMAVQSMTGMMNGYRQGRMDLYQRERQNYETGLRQVQAQNQQLQQAFERSQRLAQTDLEAARQQFQVDAVALGAELPRLAGRQAGNQGETQLLQHVSTLVGQIEQRDATVRQAAANAQPLVVPGEREGTFVYVRRDGTPIRNPQGEPLQAPPPAGSRSSRDAFGFTAITTGASNEAAASLQNLVTMASSANTGIFQGRNTTGLFNAPLGALANAVTSEQAQRYNVEIANIGKFLSQLQRGGRPVTLADIESNQRTFGIREGDTQNTILTKFATLRQQLERIMEVRIASPDTAEPLKEIFRQNLETIRAAVPFTVQDVNRFVNSQDETTTFADMFREMGIAQPAGTEERPPPRREAPVPTPAAGGNAAPQPPPPPAAAGAAYNSLAELRAAVAAGTLTREQAFAIAQQRGFTADGR